ncbi:MULTISPECIES: ATP-grasp domain-containing protein [Streptomyces]|uniref:ATP-grasp domain-containing protein n=1 Tax=Streptomyces olivaceiscleroticus TaxID=68245 RepID=A0ABN1BK03_9ACTN|nr:ATP-grasp domain-containing protein [Streptomyces niger]
MDTTRSHVVHVGFAEQHIDSIEFGEHQVSLLVNRHLAEQMSPAARQRFARIGVLDVPHTLDFDAYDRALDQMIELVEEFAAELGPPTAVVAMYEQVTLPAARLRDHFGVPGVDTETALLCRDKVRMKEVMRSNGIRVPAFWAVDASTPYADLEKIAAAVPGRLVLKPQRQAGSFGIMVFRDGTEFLAHARDHGIPDDHEVEEFIDGDVCHVDGVVRDGEIRFLSASRYIGDCLTFQNSEQHLSGVTFDDASTLARITDLTALVLKSLRLHTSTFHLELFRTPDDELIFLEIGNRFGGAYISDSIRAVYGVDLVRESVLACMGLPSEVGAVTSILDHEGVGASGWLYTALPESEPCVVKRIRGLDVCPDSVVLSEIPDIGQTLNDDIAVFPNTGKFALAGASSAEVERDIRRLAAAYAVETTPRRTPHI